MKLVKVSLVIAGLVVLLACKEHATIGDLDKAKIVTMEQIASKGLDSARMLYEGKVITLGGPLVPKGVYERNEEIRNSCTQAFGHGFSSPISGKEDSSNSYISALLKVAFNSSDSVEGYNRLNIGFDVCDTANVCSVDDYFGPQICIFSSNRLLITGKIEYIHDVIYENLENGTYKTGLEIGINPVGIKY